MPPLPAEARAVGEVRHDPLDHRLLEALPEGRERVRHAGGDDVGAADRGVVLSVGLDGDEEARRPGGLGAERQADDLVILEGDLPLARRDDEAAARHFEPAPAGEVPGEVDEADQSARDGEDQTDRDQGVVRLLHLDDGGEEEEEGGEEQAGDAEPVAGASDEQGHREGAVERRRGSHPADARVEAAETGAWRGRHDSVSRAVSKHRQIHTRPALHRGLVGADSHQRPVGARGRVGERGLFPLARHEEVVRQVRVTAAVAAALEE